MCMSVYLKGRAIARLRDRDVGQLMLDGSWPTWPTRRATDPGWDLSRGLEAPGVLPPPATLSCPVETSSGCVPLHRTPLRSV